MKHFLAIALCGAMFAGSVTSSFKKENFTVNQKASKAYWKGSARDHSHIGSFDITGSLNVGPDNNINGGEFVIPIASIEDFDMPANVKPALLGDLKSKNFFDVALHPNATFHIVSVRPVRNLKDTSAIKGANYLLTGDFQMIGKTRTMSFPARITVKHDTIVTEAKFNLDRTKWGMNIYTDQKAKLYIYPAVKISLEVMATRSKQQA